MWAMREWQAGRVSFYIHHPAWSLCACMEAKARVQPVFSNAALLRRLSRRGSCPEDAHHRYLGTGGHLLHSDNRFLSLSDPALAIPKMKEGEVYVPQ
jgi:hypothetical protein